MAIRDQTRKLLWARAHNACALCRKPLTVDALSATLPGLVLGQEAHIIARSEDGPRGRDGDRSDVDGYDNLILLCADDHTRVDAQPDVYTVQSLRKAKTTHEAWAGARAAEPEPIRLVKQLNEDQIPLSLLVSGEDVWNIVQGSHFRNLHSVSGDAQPDASDAADEFLTAATDWADIADTVRDRGFGAIREAHRSLQSLLDNLATFDLFVFGRRTKRTLEGGVGLPSTVDYAELAVLTPSQTETFADNDASDQDT
jgi:hypothetical protein